MAKKDSFVFYKSYYDAIKKIPEEYQLEIYNAILSYSLENIEPTNLSPIAEAMFILIKPNIDSSQKRYEASVENGKKGGRPKTKEKPNNNLNKTQQKPNQYLNDNVDEDVDDNEDVNVNVNDNDNVSDSCVDGLHEVIDFYNNNIGVITPFGLEVLSSYAEEMSSDLIILAMKKSVEANIRTIQYIKGILNNWRKKGIKTVIEAENEDLVFRQKDEKQETEEEKIARKTRELEEALKNDKW